jgi:signal transduction histidine kinase
MGIAGNPSPDWRCEFERPRPQFFLRRKPEGKQADGWEVQQRLTMKSFQQSNRPCAIVCMNTGAWNMLGAITIFRFPLGLSHSIWARLLYAAAGLFLVWFVYWTAVRRTEAALSVRFDEQLWERTRLARDLHDTLLQTIEASKMVADDALDASAGPVRMRQALGRLSDWLGQATEEGQAALDSLRTAGYERGDLTTSLRRVAEQCLVGRSVDFALSVTGDSIEMHPLVRDEVYSIGYEAIGNACRRSGVTRLKIALIYGSDFYLQVSDNGKDMDQLAAEENEDRQAGLNRMRKRAEQIGGRLSVISSANSGTEVTLIVPGGVIFPPRLWSRKGRPNKRPDDNHYRVMMMHPNLGSIRFAINLGQSL